MQRREPATREHAEHSESAPPTKASLELMLWEIGRAYYAYVGLAERILEQAGLADQIQPGMGLVLFALYEKDDRTIKEIAARSQLASSTLSGLLGRMERAGLIERARDTHDARLVRVRLTPLGRELEPRCQAMVEQMQGILQAGLGGHKIAQTQQLLRALTQTLRAADERMAQADR